MSVGCIRSRLVGEVAAVMVPLHLHSIETRSALSGHVTPESCPRTALAASCRTSWLVRRRSAQATAGSADPSTSTSGPPGEADAVPLPRR